MTNTRLIDDEDEPPDLPVKRPRKRHVATLFTINFVGVIEAVVPITLKTYYIFEYLSGYTLAVVYFQTVFTSDRYAGGKD